MATVANNTQAMNGGGAVTHQTLYSKGGEGGRQVTANYSFDQNSTQ